MSENENFHTAYLSNIGFENEEEGICKFTLKAGPQAVLLAELKGTLVEALHLVPNLLSESFGLEVYSICTIPGSSTLAFFTQIKEKNKIMLVDSLGNPYKKR